MNLPMTAEQTSEPLPQRNEWLLSLHKPMGRCYSAGMDAKDRNRAKIAKAVLYIEDNLSDSLRASDIAKHAHLSPFHFQRLFCAYMGESINQYTAARRLEGAALKLVHHPDANLLHLALDSGFQTHSAFSKAFRKQFNVTPSTFRKNPESAQKGTDQNRRFLINASPSKTIETTGIIEPEAFYFQFRMSSGTRAGQFFQQNDQDISQQFTALLAEKSPPDLFLMSCFPDTPQNMNDDNVPVWFGGAFSAQSNNDWSDGWRKFEAGTWAVFEHWGDYSFLYQSWNRIYRNWLTQTEYVLRDEIPFEANLACWWH